MPDEIALLVLCQRCRDRPAPKAATRQARARRFDPDADHIGPAVLQLHTP